MRRGILVVVVVAMTALVNAGTAWGSVAAIYDDCQDADQVITGKYSDKELKKALQDLPADSDEYTNCAQEIRSARLALAKASGRGHGTAASVPRVVSSTRRRNIQRALSDPGSANAKPLAVGGAVVDPGHLNSSSAIPAPLVVALALAGLSALLGAASVLDRRWRGGGSSDEE